MIGTFKRVPDGAGNVLRQVLAGFKANRSLAAPIHHERRHVDAVEIGAQVGVAQAAQTTRQ